MKMKQLEYELRFLTPAFLGNAEQSAQWRTPPIKALLRQWWRVVYAADKKFQVNLADMRREEGLLFGHAWLEDDSFERDGRQVKTAARKSRVRLRLGGTDEAGAWSPGTQQGVVPVPTTIEAGYAWFGLVRRGQGQPDRNAIRADGGESVHTLTIAVPDEHAGRLETVMRFVSQFGQLGSRSRGGWGSFQLSNTQTLSVAELQGYAQPLDACLGRDWPMSFCSDAKGLCHWESRATFNTWDQAMLRGALERRRVRSALKSVDGKDLRPALGFALAVGRMPSPLRWRVVQMPDKQLAMRVFAMPTRIPDEARKSMAPADLNKAWRTVFDALDRSDFLKPRAAAGR
jgi:CRISPR-associated protein Cmr1